MKKLLITGGTGLLGANLLKTASGRFECYSIQRENMPGIFGSKSFSADITSKEKIAQIISEVKPDFLVHTAALVGVDYCEKHKKEAETVNLLGTKNLADACRNTGCKFVFISTDSVFDGTKGNYSEEDRPNPLNVYAKTKLQSEKFLQETGLDYLIIRTNIYGWNMQDKKSLAEFFIQNLENNQKTPGFIDVIFSPVLVNNLSEAILECLEKGLSGIINIAGSEACSKFTFAKKIAKVFGFNQDLISPASVNEANFFAQRPKNTSLNINKAKGLLDTNFSDIESGLQEMKKLRENGFVAELKLGV